MLTRVLDWVVGREPVATATGLAAVVTAGLGVAAAFGLDITAEQIAAIGALAAALAGWLGRRAVTPVTSPTQRQYDRIRAQVADDSRLGDAGGIPLAMIILLVVVFLILAGVFASCDALFEDEDEPGDLGYRVELVSHEYDGGDCYGDDCAPQDYDNRGEDNRRAGISPGPFDRSPVDFRDNRVTVCFPFARCDSQSDEQEPAR